MLRTALLVGSLVSAAVVLGVSCGGGPKNVCVDKNVRCEAPLSCDPEDGKCKCGGRGGRICPEGFVCDAISNTCLTTKCANVTCSGGTTCDVNDGRCKCGGTGGVICQTGEICNPNARICQAAVSCTQVACPKNQTCDGATGKCRCGSAECPAPRFCSVDQQNSQKTCIENLCSGVTCLGATECDPADGYCKCNGVICQSGESCACPDGGSCEVAQRSCKPGSACVGVTCYGGTTCDPADGLCKCGGPGGPVCSSAQICALGPPPQCQGGQQCVLADGGAKICTGGASCDPEDGKCKCGGRGGTVCKEANPPTDPGEICISNPTQQACKRPCDPRSPDCPTGTYCYFDSTAAVPAAYCAAPTDTKTEGQACNSPTACFISNPPTALHCNGLAQGTTGICRRYCDDTQPDSQTCLQVPVAQVCDPISGAPPGYGFCRPAN